jgi:Flp pilus assembly protein TadD
VALTLRKPIMDLRDRIETLKKGDAASKTGSPEQGLCAAMQKEYEGKLGLVIGKMDQCIALMPWDWRPRMLRHEFLVNHGRFADAEKRAREALVIDPNNTEYLKMLTQALEFEGKAQPAPR